MQENVSAGAVVKRLKNVLFIMAKEGMFAARAFALKVLTRYAELLSMSCQRAIVRQRLLIEHSAIRRKGYFYSAMQ